MCRHLLKAMLVCDMAGSRQGPYEHTNVAESVYGG